MLVDEVHPSLLVCHALALTSFHEARVLFHVSGTGSSFDVEGSWARTYSMLPLFPLDSHQRVMAFFNVDVEQMLARKVLAALEASICVSLVVVNLVLVVGLESQRLSVRRQVASHGE